MNSNNRIKPCQVILHIPHSSTYIPDRFRALFYLNEKELKNELLCMTDSYTNELFDVPDIHAANRIVFPYSRLICDVERFRDDRFETMAGRGMGVCYSATSKLEPLKHITVEHRNEMLDLYDRHHADLTVAVDHIIRRSGRGLLIDCHSFASRQLVYENPGENPDLRERERPDICIGTDPAWHTPAWLQDSLVKSLSGRRYTVVLNDPFSGTLVPMKYYQDGRLLSVMIEVNRKLYMDEETGEKTAGIHSLNDMLQRMAFRFRCFLRNGRNTEKRLDQYAIGPCLNTPGKKHQ